MNAHDQSDAGEPPQPTRPRRPRYRGTHPKSYAQKYKEHDLEAYPEIESHLRDKGITPAGTHVPVLRDEVMACLRPAPGDIVADCTVGYGGHAKEFISRIAPGGRLIAMDLDRAELDRTRRRISQARVPVSFHHSNFAGIAKVMKKENLNGVDILFADLGVSSMQIDNPQRGMSYKHEGPLDMRMDDRIKRTAADWLSLLSEEELDRALSELADEPDCCRIAHLVIQRRTGEPITRTSQLVRLILDAKGLTAKAWREQRRTSASASLHPAARTFQALRILVNDELGSLKELLRLAPHCLRPRGRIGIVSFHSGEDRLVKQAFREGLRNGTYQSAAPDVIVPQLAEIRSNPRSASAKFRWAEVRSS